MTDSPPKVVATRIVQVPVGDLKPHPANARVHDIPKLRALIRAHGFVTAIGVQKRTSRIVIGHGRFEAAKLEGMTKVPVIYLDVPDAEALELLAGDNEASDAASWDPARYAVLLERIRSKARPEAAGFEPARLDAMIERLRRRSDTDPATDSEGPDPIRPPTKPVTKAGDVWQLGPHRLMCGDARKAADVRKLIGSTPVNVAVTSPPYADRREYDATSGFKPVPPDEYVAWFAPVAAHVAQHLADDGSWFVNIKPGAEGLDTELYVHDLVAAHVREWGWHFVTELCWERNGVPKRVSRRFKNQFEPVFHFARAEFKMRPDNVRVWSAAAVTPQGVGATAGYESNGQGGAAVGESAVEHRRGMQLGSLQNAAAKGKKFDRFRLESEGTVEYGDGTRTLSTTGGPSRIAGTGEPSAEAFVGEGLAYPGNRLPTFAGSHEATGHSAAFPVGLPAWFIKAYSDPGDAVYDPFTGSGSTLLAAHETDRIGFGMERSPAYCDVVCQRFERHTGIVPVLVSTGKARSFDTKRKRAKAPTDDPSTASKRQGRGGVTGTRSAE